MVWRFPECESRAPFTSLSKWNPECHKDYPEGMPDKVVLKVLDGENLRGMYRKCKWLLSRGLCPNGLEPVYE